MYTSCTAHAIMFIPSLRLQWSSDDVIPHLVISLEQCCPPGHHSLPSRFCSIHFVHFCSCCYNTQYTLHGGLSDNQSVPKTCLSLCYRKGTYIVVYGCACRHLSHTHIIIYNPCKTLRCDRYQRRKIAYIRADTYRYERKRRNPGGVAS